MSFQRNQGSSRGVHIAKIHQANPSNDHALGRQGYREDALTYEWQYMAMMNLDVLVLISYFNYQWQYIEVS